MEPGVLQNVLLFLTDTLLSLYALVFLLRFLFMLVQADFYNPLSQAVVKLTEGPVGALRRFIPPVGRADLACWLLAYGLKVLSLVLIGLIQGKVWPLAPLLLIGLIQLGETLIYIYIFSVIILAVSSWFMSGVQAFSHPLIFLLYSLTSPVLAPLRRFMPSAGVLDLSPLALLLVLYLLLIILRSLY